MVGRRIIPGVDSPDAASQKMEKGFGIAIPKKMGKGGG